MGLFPSRELHDERKGRSNKLITTLEGCKFETHFSGYSVGGYWDPAAEKADRFEFKLQHVCLKPPAPLQYVILNSEWHLEFKKINGAWKVKYDGNYHHSFIQTGNALYQYLIQCGAERLSGESVSSSQPQCWRGLIEHSTDWRALDTEQMRGLIEVLQSISSERSPTPQCFIQGTRVTEIEIFLDLPQPKDKKKPN